jgi:hypothetical protein
MLSTSPKPKGETTNLLERKKFSKSEKENGDGRMDLIVDKS